MSQQNLAMQEPEPISLEFFTFLTELIQLYTLSKTPRVIELRGPGGALGKICLADNTIQHAQVDDVMGEEAFFQIATWGYGEIIKQREMITTMRTVEVEQLSNLLMDAFWYAEEAAHVRAAEGAAANSDATVGFSREATHPRIWVPEQDAIRDQPTPTPTPDGLAEDTLDPNDDSQSKIEEFQRVWRKRLAWGERVGQALGQVEGLLVYHIFDQHGDPLHDSGLEEDSDSSFRQIPAALIRTLESLDVLDTHVELVLTTPEHHHIVMSIANAPDYLVHGLFLREEVTLAMAHWKLSTILQDADG